MGACAAQVAVRAQRDPAQGIMYVWLDADYEAATRLDLSSLYRDGQDTIVWRSKPLEYREHTVTVRCGGQSGIFSNSVTSSATTLAGFLVLNDPSALQQCGAEMTDCLV